jgi:ABC-type bacteriocin/lantibiotic exporter with double-glycine peptidase domain
MVYDAYGIEVSESEIEHSVEMTPRGTTMLALNDQAERSGLSASGWRLTMEELRRSKFPAILFVRGDHFIVADSVREENVYLRDPAIGRLKISEKSLARIWRGEALVFCRK